MAAPKFKLFEKSSKDKEVKSKGKEGSRREEKFDKKQMQSLACGGAVGKKRK